MNMILKDHNYCFNETGMETERLNVGKASAEKKYNVIWTLVLQLNNQMLDNLKIFGAKWKFEMG